MKMNKITAVQMKVLTIRSRRKIEAEKAKQAEREKNGKKDKLLKEYLRCIKGAAERGDNRVRIAPEKKYLDDRTVLDQALAERNDKERGFKAEIVDDEDV